MAPHPQCTMPDGVACCPRRWRDRFRTRSWGVVRDEAVEAIPQAFLPPAAALVCSRLKVGTDATSALLVVLAITPVALVGLPWQKVGTARHATAAHKRRGHPGACQYVRFGPGRDPRGPSRPLPVRPRLMSGLGAAGERFQRAQEVLGRAELPWRQACRKAARIRASMTSARPWSGRDLIGVLLRPAEPRTGRDGPPPRPAPVPQPRTQRGRARSRGGASTRTAGFPVRTR